MIRVSEPSLLGNEERYVVDCLRRNELSWQGEYVQKFESEFAKYCGVKHAISCSNGTVALHLALIVLGVGPGDDVFLPALTYISTANAIRYCGANPVFCDIDDKSWCLDPLSVRQAIERSRNPKVILPVHLYGVPADMTSFRELSLQFHIPIVEDAAEALGASWHDKKIGSGGDLATFSFYSNKMITTGEGGMVITNDDFLASKLRLYRGQGQTTQYFHSVIGYNYRMSNINAAIGLAQLENIDIHLRNRTRIAEYYRSYLNNLEWQIIPKEGRSSYWMNTTLLPKGVPVQEFRQMLLDDNIETRPMFIPLTRMPPYFQMTPYWTDKIADRGVSLPSHANLSRNQVASICEKVNSLISVACAN